MKSEREKEGDRKWYIKNRARILKKQKKYYKDNCKEILKKQKEYKQNNFEKISARRKIYRLKYHEKRYEYNKKYRKSNLEEVQKTDRRYRNNKRKTNLKYNLNRKMSIVINLSLKKNKNNRHWETLVDYSLADLIKRLKRTMPKDYTWQDFLEGKLHIDHIIPKSVFNYTEPEHPDFKRCWSLRNLQLLPAKENRKKYNKISRPFQPALQILGKI